MLPEGWSVLKLDDVVTKTQLGTTARGTEDKSSSNSIPLIKMGNLGWGSINFKKVEMIDQSYFDESLLLERGDFLFNTRNTPDLVGKSAVWLENYPATFDNNINRISFKPVIDSYYISYYLNNGKGKSLIQALPAGSTSVAAIYWKDLKNIKLVLPPLPEQKKIAQILSTWDNAISATERLLENSQQRKKALMQQLLTGKKRLPGFEGEWEEVKLGDVAKMNSGGTPSSTVPEYYGGDIPWVSIADMTKQGKWIDRTEKYITELGLSNSSARIYPENTVLYAMYASIGECSIATVPLSSSQAILGIRAGSHLNHLFLYYFLVSMKDKIKLQGQQGTQANLNAGMVKEFTLSLPPIQEQQAIANVLTTADQEIEALQKRLDHLKLEKKALMQQLLTGKRRVQVDDAA